MKTYLQGTAVTLTIPLVDRAGTPLNVASIAYYVVDQAGSYVSDDIEVEGIVAVTSTSVPLAPLAGFIAGSPTAVVTMSPTINTMATYSTAELRNVQLQCTLADGNTILVSEAYAVTLADPLQVGINSFMTYANAEFTALSIPNIPGWDGASDKDRIAALIDARSHICQLNFSQLNSNVNWGQDSLSYVPEGTYPTNFASPDGMFLFSGNLSFLTVEQFVQLPPRFLNALYLAQVAESDDILQGDPVVKRRQEGMMLESIGESKQMYRPSKPLQLPCCRRALGYLSYFLSFTKGLTRR